MVRQANRLAVAVDGLEVWSGVSHTEHVAFITPPSVLGKRRQHPAVGPGALGIKFD
jgi:hypothetical protein